MYRFNRPEVNTKSSRVKDSGTSVQRMALAPVGAIIAYEDRLRRSMEAHDGCCLSMWRK
jgi:hypothetical protein